MNGLRGYRTLACMAAFLPAAPAWSQNAISNAGAPPIEDITVTARREQEDLQKIPVAETMVSADKIETLSINTPLDLNKIAGLGGIPVGALTSVNFTIRGQGTAFGGQPGVIPYFAEVPNFPLTYFDLANIQVIKGPQGTLFGQTSTGGVVLFEPNRPSDRFGGYIDLQLGNHRYTQVEGAVNVPVIADRLYVRAAFQLRNRKGWASGIDSNGGSNIDLNNIDNASARISVTWKPANNVENYAVFAEDKIRNNGTSSPLYYVDPRFMNPAVRNLVPSAIPSLAAKWDFWTGYAPPPGQTFAQLLNAAFQKQAAAGPLTMYTDYSERNTTINRGVIDQTTWQIADFLKVKNIFGLRWQTVQGATYDQDGTNLPLLDFQCRFVPGTTSSNGTCAKIGGWPNRTLTDELQVQGKSLGGKLQWQLGAFYLQSGIRRYREDSRPFVVFGTLSGDPASAAFCASVNVASPCASMSRTNTHSYAVFGQATYELVDQVHVTAGYRETWDYTRTDTTGKVSYQVPYDGQMITVPVYGGSPAPGASVVSTTVKLPANASYNVSADWQVNNRVLLYAAHRSGYKTGGINTVADPGSPDRTYGPEHVKDLEIGIKSQWNVGKMHVLINADYYHTWYNDLQEGEIIPGTAQTITSNLANAQINGIEVEGTLVPVGWFRLSGNVALTDAHYTNWLEHSSCSAQYWRPQCNGLPGTTEITIDHAGGTLDIAGQTIAFTPDRFANASRWQWSIQPSIVMSGLLGEDVTFSANVYHRGPYVDAVAVANTSKIAGVPSLTENTVFGNSTSNPYDASGYTLVDLRADWRHIRGSQFSAALAVTNVANNIYRVSSASAFEIIGAVYSLTGEPRMEWLQIKYEF